MEKNVPSFFDCNSFNWVFRIGDVTDFLHGRHEGAETDVAGVRHDGPLLAVDVALLDERNHPLEVDQKSFAPFRNPISLGDETSRVKNPVRSEFSV